MTRFLISFDDGAMAHIPDEDWPAVGEASHAVVREAKAAGVWIHGGGVEKQRASIVGTSMIENPPITALVSGDGPSATTPSVPTREDALEWAAKIAVACRCAQEVRELMDDPEA
jgi:hypothetical protein